MFVQSFGSAIVGIDALKITVEVNISSGIGMFLVGLPDNAVKESQERIRSAYQNSGYKMSGKKIVVNLAPAAIRKEGSAYDLTIAVAILAATEQINVQTQSQYVIMGELSLGGDILPVKGVLPMAIKAREDGFKGVIIPKANAAEAAVVDGLDVYGVGSLGEVADFLNGIIELEPQKYDGSTYIDSELENIDFADVKGQQYVKRALEVAASGGHNIIMIGSPGSGKTMLARRMTTIMPPMTMEESLETTKIHSVAGKTGATLGLLTTRPFRAPHHLASQVSLTGGGASPMPGEVSLAHNGILFMDELPEFGRATLEILRQPLEEKHIVVSRAKYTVDYPCNFMLLAAMNPCPCGYHNHPTKECVCSPAAVIRYMNRISGPMLDRIDMHIEVSPVCYDDISSSVKSESSAQIRERVIAARKIQSLRFKDEGIYTNSMMNSAQINSYCVLSEQCRAILKRAMMAFNLSARAYDRILKLSRTLADMASSEDVKPEHIAEAIRYRSLDREN
ncbi:MAG: YifB family Mg chelatase-like AAA ATPase [Rikenellaceae bacterium]